jgi:centrosomal protein CEP76
LVINVDKAQGLPIADIDDGSSDPYIRVTWDNITKQSPVMAENLNPVFKYRAYFPVRFGVQLMQKNAKIEKKYQRVYECELNSDIKGVKLEVFDNDDTSAEMLGMTSVPMWKVLKSVQQKRSMLGKPKSGDDGEEELLVQNDGQEEAPSSNSQWYDREVLTRVYDGKKTPLRNSALKNDKAAFVFFEAYFYPAWDASIDLEEPVGGLEAGDPWKALRDGWDRERGIWKDSYCKTFPDAIGSLPHVAEGNDRGDVRIFTCVADHPLKTPAMTPLMSFLCPIIIPEDEGFPARLMHLINCLTFESQGDHLRTGRISRSSWHDSDHVLAKRKGTVWDHAVLLCSLLLGCKKDAYICKGLIKRANTGDTKRQMSEYIEHVWVMTREKETGWVTFWEPCTHQRFHLPHRCKKQPKAGKGLKKDKKGQKSRTDSSANDQASQNQRQDMELFQTSQVADGEVLAAQETLPMVGRKPWPKVKSGKNKAPVGGSGREGGTESASEVLLLPMAPDLEMLKFQYAPDPKKSDPKKSDPKDFADSTLVTWLPYSSIDVVFNDKSLWANQQNHHPGCITYDMDEQRHGPKAKWKPKWVPLNESGNEDTKFEPITPQVKLLPPLKGSQAQGLEDDLLSELRQTIALFRQTRGNDTAWDQKEELVSKIRKYLDIWELWMQLDIDNPEVKEFFKDDIEKYLRKLTTPHEDHDEAQDKKSKQSRDDTESKRSAKTSSGGAGAGGVVDDRHVGKFIRENFKEDFLKRYCNIYGSPDFVDTPLEKEPDSYQKDQKARIDDLKLQVGEFLKESQKVWPVKRGLKFDGFPVHFSDPDREQVRQYFMNMKQFLNAAEDEADDVVHTVVCKLFPLPGRVLSVWVYIGWQKSVTEDGDEDDEDEEGGDEGGEE